MSKICILLVAALYWGADVQGHGMMMDPINRASLWRVDPSAPIDYDDNQLYCGGQSVQWNINDGKCGMCGDDYRDEVPRLHENTGKYGEGKIVANYTRGEIIHVSVKLSTNHKGWFQFSVCPLAHPKALETDECFRNVTLADGSDVYKLPTTNSGMFDIDVKLPDDLTCEHCVFRWNYRCGNTWGICEDGHGADGCGPQETFRSCSDVAIF